VARTTVLQWHCMHAHVLVSKVCCSSPFCPSNLLHSGRVSRIVVMCGAGISVSAGIPDFRTPGTGLYSQVRGVHSGNVPAEMHADDKHSLMHANRDKAFRQGNQHSQHASHNHVRKSLLPPTLLWGCSPLLFKPPPFQAPPQTHTPASPLLHHHSWSALDFQNLRQSFQ
jgi:Sir2 family